MQRTQGREARLYLGFTTGKRQTTYMQNGIFDHSPSSDLSGSACDCQTRASNMQYVFIPLYIRNIDIYAALSNARRVPQFSTAVSIGFILMSDPCLPPLSKYPPLTVPTNQARHPAIQSRNLSSAGSRTYGTISAMQSRTSRSRSLSRGKYLKTS